MNLIYESLLIDLGDLSWSEDPVDRLIARIITIPQFSHHHHRMKCHDLRVLDALGIYWGAVFIVPTPTIILTLVSCLISSLTLTP